MHPPPSRTHQPTVLVVEDDEMIRDAMTRILVRERGSGTRTTVERVFKSVGIGQVAMAGKSDGAKRLNHFGVLFTARRLSVEAQTKR